MMKVEAGNVMHTMQELKLRYEVHEGNEWYAKHPASIFQQNKCVKINRFTHY
jgi:hypothetical protein